MDLRIEPYPTQGHIRWVEPLVTVATNDLFQKKKRRSCAQISCAVLCRIKLVENSKPATRLQAPQKNDCLPDYHGDFHTVLLGSHGLLGKTFPSPGCTDHQGRPQPIHRGTDAQFVQGVASPRVHLLRLINGCHSIDAFLAKMGMTEMTGFPMKTGS